MRITNELAQNTATLSVGKRPMRNMIFRERVFLKIQGDGARAILAMAVIALSLSVPVSAQAEHPITGRRIAPVMGMSGADWLARREREREEMPEKVIQQLHLRPGMVVADIGAGTGYYSIRIAREVAPNGKVLANDIQAGMLARVRENAANAHLSNVETILGSESNPHLPTGQVDLAIMVDVYHELSRPQRMLEHIHDALRPGGQLVLLEFRKEDPSVPIRLEHKMSVDEIKAEIQPEGFHFVQTIESLPWQHMVFFEKTGN